MILAHVLMDGQVTPMHLRDGPPYAWWGAAGGAIALGLMPWVPLAPFFGATARWAKWFAESILGGSVMSATSDSFLTVFLPLLGAATFAWPFLVLAAGTQGCTKVVVRSARVFTVLLVLLAGVEIADVLLAAHSAFGVGRIVVTCASGLSLAALGIGLGKAVTRAKPWMRALRGALLVSGFCVASYVLLPVGLLGLLLAYILLAGVLLRRDHLGTEPQASPS